jgi:hypothetical protein
MKIEDKMAASTRVNHPPAGTFVKAALIYAVQESENEEDEADDEDVDTPYHKGNKNDHASRDKCYYDNTDSVGIENSVGLVCQQSAQNIILERLTSWCTAVTVTVPIINNQLAMGM